MSTDFDLKARGFVFLYQLGTDNFEGQFELDYIDGEKLRQVLRLHAAHALAGSHRLNEAQRKALKHFVVGDEDPVKESPPIHASPSGSWSTTRAFWPNGTPGLTAKTAG